MDTAIISERGEEFDPVSKRLFIDVVAVSSATAERWLTSHNTHNRKISDAAVERYRAEMQAGRWAFAADPIRFDANGVLLDGQHRLWALALCEPSIVLPFLVARGLPPESQLVMDQGVKRTPGQQLSLIGTKEAHFVASCVRQLVVWEDGLLFRDVKMQGAITAPRIQEWVTANPERVAALQEHSGTVKRNEARPSVAGAFFLHAHRSAPGRAVEFFDMLASGANLEEGHPVLALIRRLRRIGAEPVKITNRELLGLFLVAWNHWASDRTLSRLQAPKGGWSAENFPELTVRGER